MKTLLRFGIAAFLPLFLLLGIAAPSAFANASSIDKSIVYLDGTVRGVVQYQDPSTGAVMMSDELTATFTCTGWFVTPEGAIVTAGHCVDMDAAREMLEQEFASSHTREITDISQLFEPQPEGPTIVSIRGTTHQEPEIEMKASQMLFTQGTVLPGPDDAVTVRFDGNLPPGRGDLALLHLNVQLPKPAPVLRVAQSSPEELTTPILAVGYPGVVGMLLEERPAVSSASEPAEPEVNEAMRVSKFPGVVSSRQPVRDFCNPCLETSAVMQPGMSGGPLIDAKTHEVYGVISAGISSATINYAVDTPELRKFLTAHGINVDPPNTTVAAYGSKTQEPSQDNGDSSRNVADIVIGAALGACIVVIILLTVLLVRRAPSTTSTSGKHRHDETVAQDQPTS